MLHTSVLQYGSENPLPRQTALRAGPLELIYEEGDLRTIRCGRHELIRRIYSAVRDRSWGTVPPMISEVRMDIGADRFDISYRVENKQNEIHFAWQAEIKGTSAGEITFRMTGEALSTFIRSRIGFCVLHPAGAAGANCLVTQVDGSSHAAAFPSDLDPSQPPLPFTDISAMSYSIGGVEVEIEFEGDAFEMEDQRNWTDASFKTFCTPLRLPYPVEIQAGTRIAQTVSVRLRTPAAEAPTSDGAEPIGVRVEPAAVYRLPRIGLGLASHGLPLSPLEVTRLSALKLDHLRADLDLASKDYARVLRHAAAESNQLDLPLHLALHITNEAQIQAFQQLLTEIRPRVGLWLIYPAQEDYTGHTPLAETIAWTRKYLSGPFAAGTNTDFIFLQRNLPPPGLDYVTLAIHPQAHAFDNLSLMETLEAQTQVLATAYKISNGTPLIVSPITLRPRFNPYTSAPPAPVPPGELPPQVDPRQMSLFCAAWTLGSLRSMAIGGAASTTYYETSGWRGIMETASGSPVPQKFLSPPGAVFPVYHLLATLAPFSGGDLIPLHSTNQLKVQAFMLRKDGRERVYLANLSPQPQSVFLNNLPRKFYLRILSDFNTIEAMTNPEAFLALSPELFENASLNLPAYAFAWLDIA
jgi:hypothetical protein